MNRVNWKVILWLLTLLLVSACDKKPKSQEATEGDVEAITEQGEESGEFEAGYQTDMLTFALAADPETFDTAKMSGAPEAVPAFNLFEGLLMPGPTTEGLADDAALLQYGAAESYTISEDGTVYTFKIRENAKWSDGTPLTAHDFEWSWKRMLMPGFPADYVNFLWLIKGAEEFNKARTEDWSTVGIKSIDDHTLEVTLTHAAPYFLELVAFYTFFPVPRAVVEKHGVDWTRPENIVSNGPYTMESYTPQQEIILKKSPSYWDADKVAVEKVRLKIITDSNAIVNAYKTGELHWTGAGLPIAQIASLLTHPDYERHPMLGVYFYRFNVEAETPLKNPKVRAALSAAIDRKSLVDNTLNGIQTPATSFVPPMAGWEPSKAAPYSIKKAKDLLAEAGYPNGEGFPSISLLYNTDENHKLIAETVQDMWKRNLNIDVKLHNKEWKTYLQDVDTLSFEIARAGWIGDYNDPMTFLEMWTSENGNNDTGWSDKEYDDLIATADRESDSGKRHELLKKAEAILEERGPITPIYYYSQNMLVARKLKGFEPHNRDIHLIKYMTLEK